MKQLYTLIESRKIFTFDALLEMLGIRFSHFNSARAFNKAIKKEPPDFVIAEFLYGFGNNYAGINISNLDVSLYALQRYAPEAKIIILTAKADQAYIPKLQALFDVDQILEIPIKPDKLRTAIINVI